MILIMYVIFFFKQKTAYEMRISDWSSDVCSSDLRLQGRHRALMSDVGRGPIIMVSILPRERMVASRVGVEADIRLAAQSVDDLCARLGRTKFIQLGKMQHERSAEVLSLVENGRAPCRERVCQYV